MGTHSCLSMQQQYAITMTMATHRCRHRHLLVWVLDFCWECMSNVDITIYWQLCQALSTILLAPQLVCVAMLQIFAQPVFENVETFMTKRQLWPSGKPWLMRAIVRSLYVMLTTFVAICLPFFADLMGLIGAAGFTPMTFILPCVFWLKVRLVFRYACCLPDLNLRT